MVTEAKVHTFTGFDEVKNYYYSIHDQLQSGDEVLVLGARSGNPQDAQARDFFQEYIADRQQHGISTRILFNKDVQAVAQEYEGMNDVGVRYMPEGIQTPVGTDIYNNNIAFLDWNGAEPRVTVIEDENIARSYKESFEVMWSSSALITDLMNRGQYWLPEILFDEFRRFTDEKEQTESAMLEIVDRYEQPRVLQVGAGAGDFISKLSDRCSEMTLVEKNAGYVATYENDARITVLNQDFETAPIEGAYDVIIAAHVFYYFEDFKEAFQHMQSLLAPGGVILLVVNSAQGGYGDIKRFFFNDVRGVDYVFTYDKLANVVKLSGASFSEHAIECSVWGKSVEELYYHLRCWFEMDLQGYQENKDAMLAYLEEHAPGNTLSFENTIFEIRG